MKKFIFIALTSLVCWGGKAQTSEPDYPFRNAHLSASERTEDLISRMTLEEKIDLLAGYNDFYLHPCARLGIPAFRMADGPLGVASWGLWGRATAFPAALSVAASWNRDLAYRIGEMYAAEWRARGLHFMLAPGVNIYRASKGARNFEYYGEDPVLTSQMIVPFIQAVQKGGVIATVKHFAGNDQEFDRYTVSTEVSRRALHEIYLRPFRAAVEEAGVKAVMTGYNPLNGTYCTENKWLIDVLKKDWGFKGMLMSDWACTYSADKAANNGLDLEMGSKDWFNRQRLLPLIKDGTVSEATINDKVRRIYGTCIEMGFFDRDQRIDTIPLYNPAASRMALKGAEEGMVLLKNSNLLPLKSPRRIAVIGPTANPPLINDRAFNTNGIVYGGGGSSRVHPWHVVNDLEGIKNEFPEAEVLYAEGISNQFRRRLFQSSVFKTADGRQGLDARYFSIGKDHAAMPATDVLAQQAKAAGRETTQAVSAATAGKGDTLMRRTDRQVNFEWWGTPDGKYQFGDEYGAEWTGFVDAQKTDSLRFFVDAQGAYQLFVNGQLLADASRSQSFHFSSPAIWVQKGDRLEILLKYRSQRSHPSEIRLGYCNDSDLDFSEAKRIAAKADVVVFCAGLDGSIELEGRDRPFDLPYGQDRLIRELCRVNPNTVVVLHAGGGINMTPWIDSCAAAIHAFYPGEEGGNALAHILSGKVNPSAKLPFTIERRWADSPAAGNYDETRREKKIYYREGIFTGYRGYEKRNIAPLFPFGYGLSYTTYKYDDLDVRITDRSRATVTVSFNVTNTGKMAGGEVTQLYVADVKSKEPRPLKELKAFEKVWLQPGETRRVTLHLSARDFEYYSEKADRWVFEKGAFIIKVGASSQDIRLEKQIKL